MRSSELKKFESSDFRKVVEMRRLSFELSSKVGQIGGEQRRKNGIATFNTQTRSNEKKRNQNEELHEKEECSTTRLVCWQEKKRESIRERQGRMSGRLS